MLDWILGLILFTLYLVFLFTVCRVTFDKGYTIFGWLGIFFPILWLFGAIMPAKLGSRFDLAEVERYRQRIAAMDAQKAAKSPAA